MFFINTIKNACEKHMLLKKHVILTCLKDTYHFYMWSVGNFSSYIYIYIKAVL